MQTTTAPLASRSPRLSFVLLARIRRLDACRGRWIVDCRAFEDGAGYALRDLDSPGFWPTASGRTWGVERPEPAPHRISSPEDAALYCAATGWQSKLLWIPEALDDDSRWPGGYSAPSHILSNARVFRADFAKELKAGADGGADGLSLDVRFVTPDMLESLESLEDYPILDESDWSELEVELQDEDWRNWAQSDWRKEVLKALESMAPDDAADAEEWAEATADALGDDKLVELFNLCADASNTYWEEQVCGSCSEGFWIDLSRCAEALAPFLSEAMADVAPVPYAVEEPAPELPQPAPDAPQVTIALGAKRVSVPAVWVGSALAVHRTYGAESPMAWVITHLASGLSVAKFSSALGETAVTLARQWDDRFRAVTAENANSWELKEAWIAARSAAGGNA